MFINKVLHRGIGTACLLLALTAASHAQIGTPEFDPLGEHDDLPKQIRVQVDYIDVSQEQLTELLNGEKPAANDVELHKQVAQLVDSGKATMMETMLCTARSGQRARTDSIEEVIYPTEYEPAQLPDTNASASDEKDDAVKAQPTRSDSAIGPTPTSFETRNVGSHIEIEPTLSPDNKSINLTLAPEIVYHVGNKVWAEWKGEHGNSPIQMPTFYVLRIDTSVTLADGKPLLIGALTPKTQDGKADFTRKIMVFVKADVITVGR